jgi:ligand-binding sensor domain-containing protein
MRSITPLLMALSLVGLLDRASAQTAIGQWRDHFQYRHTVTAIEGDGNIYCATTSAIFKYDEQTGETERFTKVNALSDVNILSLGWSSDRHTLLVGYKNGDLDVISGSSATNLPDIKRSSITGDKGIYSITCQGALAYLSCGFGIVVVDLAKMEVKDTWIIGPDAGQLQVNGVMFLGDSIYAATQQGLFVAWRNAPNLAAYTNWHRRMDLPSPTKAYSAVVAFNGRPMVNRRYNDSIQSSTDTIYVFNNGWQPMTATLGDHNRTMNVSADGLRLVVTQRDQVREFDTSFAEVYGAYSIGGQAIRPVWGLDRVQGGSWVATDGYGLVRFQSDSNYSTIFPNGPKNNSVYKMASAQGALYVTTGGPSGIWDNDFLKDGVHYLVDGVWNTTDRTNDALYDQGANTFGGTVNDVLPVVVDPQDGHHAFVGSWDDGLLEFQDGHVVGFFGAANSTLQRFHNGTTTDVPTRVGGLAYDANGNLWVSNSDCTEPISVRMKNGTWHSFSMGTALGNNALLSDIIVGTNGYKWVLRPRSSGLLVFTDNGTPSDPDDDQAKALTTFEGEGKLPSMDVFSVAEDKDQQIWVGTGKGVAVFYDPDAVFSNSNFDAQQILIEQDGNVQILLETETVSAIAVDGANRKWLGTLASGVYLVSPDGTKLLAHFTAANSPLPSDDITCLNIDGNSGEVYIGTDLGIMGYRGDATEGGTTEDCATVFPNPVRETYTGPIAITGLMRGSDVRITDIAGNLVYHTTSNGGQAIWPATDMNGNRVGTGVYLVFVMDPTGASTCNTKVMVVR